MFQSARFKRIIFCFLMISFISMLACQGDEAPLIASSADPPPEPADFEDDGDVKGGVYFAGNPYHENIFTGLLEQADVSVMLGTFEARGFELSPARCFTIDGNDGDSAGSVTFIVLEGAGQVGDQTVLIACFDVDGKAGVSPAVFSVQEPDDEPGWTSIGDYGWMKTGGLDGIDRSAARFDSWSWGFFWDCMKIKAPGPMVGCSITCLMVGPGYWHCMLTCVATQAVVATVSCVIQTCRNGATDKKEDPKDPND